MDMDVTVSVIVLAALAGTAVMLRQRRPNPRALARLADGVNRLRTAAGRETRYQPVAAGAVNAMPGAGYYDAATREIEQSRCRMLADLAEIQPDGTPTQPARWFVDETGTICGWYAIVGGAQGPAVRQIMLVASEAPDGEYYSTTRGGAGSSTATSPKHHLAECAWAGGLGRQLEVHRAQIPADRRAALTHIATIDDATAIFARSRKAKMAWRAQQPADALLDRDLRQILQDRYPAIGTALAAFMRAHPDGS